MAQNTGETVNVRKLALEVFLDIMENGIFCNQALHAAFETHDLEKRDRSFLMRLVEGSVERCIQLDYIINQFSKVKTSDMKPVIRGILRISVYQILYMKQIPDSAACNEAVKLTGQRKLQNLKGFVNGVLRSIVRNKEKLSFPDKKDMVNYLSVCYSMPIWIVERFIREYGVTETERILKSFLQEKEGVSLRCMTSRFSVEEIKGLLEEEGAVVSKGRLLPYALHMKGYPSLTGLTAFQRGMVQIQDESSMLVGQISCIKEGDTVIDVCAAPGGKTFHAADILAGTGTVISADLSQEKTALIQENKKRLAVENVTVFRQDASVLREEWIGKADVVIADLPCSGLGVIGRKCDIKYKTKEEDITSLAEIQRKILRVASQYVKGGGRFLYSTCTIAKEENEENVRWIEENLPLLPVSIEKELPDMLKGQTGERGYLQVLPDRTGTDGFFISAFVRKREE